MLPGNPVRVASTWAIMKVGTLVRNWIVRALFLLIAAPIALFVMMTVLWCAIQALMPGGNQYMFANVYLFLPIVLGAASSLSASALDGNGWMVVVALINNLNAGWWYTVGLVFSGIYYSVSSGETWNCITEGSATGVINMEICDDTGSQRFAIWWLTVFFMTIPAMFGLMLHAIDLLIIVIKTIRNLNPINLAKAAARGTLGTVTSAVLG